MTLRITDWLITSDITPETATYDPTGDGWVLSWLSGRSLTKIQALSGMALDEFLSDFDLVTAADTDTPTEDVLLAFAVAAARAAELGITLEEAVIRLSSQILQRDRNHARTILSADRAGGRRSIDPTAMRPAGEGIAV
ncbi:hypothetical protein [Nocardia uniformis]|uniref:hypothetical protein n=1 Tax=Nocardia uniformis TaxID=53432 RepID=UPI00157CF70B|nr:hypothetical protein [Nocardia uniformis]